MYKKYHFNTPISNVYVVGDTHGSFRLIQYKIKSDNIEDSVIIVAGDCGFGFEKEAHYKNVYNKMKKTLIESNVKLVFVRGNHDDPLYFDGEVINFPNFIAIPDYSVLIFNDVDVTYNVLCVGGAISIDRVWRKNNELKYRRNLYWDGESPYYSEDILNAIKLDGINIDAMITHTTPSFAPPTDKNGISSFTAIDKDLAVDVDSERRVMDEIYNHIVKKDKHPMKLIIHGHFHSHSTYYSEEEVKIVGLDMCHERNNSWDIYPLRRYK